MGSRESSLWIPRQYAQPKRTTATSSPPPPQRSRRCGAQPLSWSSLAFDQLPQYVPAHVPMEHERLHIPWLIWNDITFSQHQRPLVALCPAVSGHPNVSMHTVMRRKISYRCNVELELLPGAKAARHCSCSVDASLTRDRRPPIIPAPCCRVETGNPHSREMMSVTLAVTRRLSRSTPGLIYPTHPIPFPPSLPLSSSRRNNVPPSTS